MGDEAANYDSLHAAKVVVSSERFRPLFAWILSILLTSVGGVVGWGVKVLTDNSAQTRMANDIAAIKTDIAAIKGDNKLRNELLEDSFRKPGKVIQLERDQEVVWREIAKLYAATYATEADRTRKAKRSAGLEMKESYDGRVKGGATPIAAYTEVTRTVSVR